MGWCLLYIKIKNRHTYKYVYNLMKRMSGENMEKINDFEIYLINNEKSQATIKKYVREIKEFLCWLQEEEITKEKLIYYRKILLDKHKPQTVNIKLSAINTFLKFAGMENIKVKFVKVQRQSFLDDSKELSEREYKRLLKAALEARNERLYMIMVTLCSTGIRISELKYITTEAVKNGRANINMKGKYRIIILSKDLCNKLKEYIRKNKIREGCIFCTKSGKAMDRANIFHRMKKLCKRANVDSRKVFPHNFRHLFARKFYEIEKNLSHLADVLGHSRIETTRIYVAAGISSHKKILNKMKLVL